MMMMMIGNAVKFTTMHICSKTHWLAREPEIACPRVHHPDDDNYDDADDDDVDDDDDELLMVLYT